MLLWRLQGAKYTIKRAGILLNVVGSVNYFGQQLVYSKNFWPMSTSTSKYVGDLNEMKTERRWMKKWAVANYKQTYNYFIKNFAKCKYFKLSTCTAIFIWLYVLIYFFSAAHFLKPVIFIENFLIKILHFFTNQTTWLLHSRLNYMFATVYTYIKN